MQRRSAALRSNCGFETRLTSSASSKDFPAVNARSEEHTSELQSPCNLVCRLLLEKKKKLMVLALICLGNNRQDCHPPNCMFSCLQILEAFLWFVLITLLNVTLIILTLSVSRLLNLLLRLVSFLIFLNPQCLAFFFLRITAPTAFNTFSLLVSMPF